MLRRPAPSDRRNWRNASVDLTHVARGCETVITGTEKPPRDLEFLRPVGKISHQRHVGKVDALRFASFFRSEGAGLRGIDGMLRFWTLDLTELLRLTSVRGSMRSPFG